jgi:hypothetical protein
VAKTEGSTSGIVECYPTAGIFGILGEKGGGGYTVNLLQTNASIMGQLQVFLSQNLCFFITAEVSNTLI